MPRYTFKYHEEDYGTIGFDADNLQEAQKLFESISEGAIDYEDLPNYSRRTRGGEVQFIDLEETQTALPTIPMLLKTGE